MLPWGFRYCCIIIMNTCSCGGLLRGMVLNSFVSICTSRRNNCGKTKKGCEQLLRSRRWAVDKHNRSNKSSPVGYECVKLCRHCGRAVMLHHSRHGSQTAGGSWWRLTDCSPAPRMDVSAKNFKLEAKWNTSRRVRGGGGMVDPLQRFQNKSSLRPSL